MPVDVGPNGSASEDRPEVELLPSGKVRITLEVEDGEGGITPRAWVLRRPKIGQMKRLRELLWEEQDRNRSRTLEEARRRAHEVLEAAKKEEQNPGATQAERIEATLKGLEETYAAAKSTREQGVAVEVTYLDWVRTAVKMLSGQSLDVDDDQLPYILVTSNFVSALQNHWRTVPFGSGQSVE